MLYVNNSTSTATANANGNANAADWAGSSPLSLKQLVYSSEASAPLTPAELEALLIHWRYQNRRDGITGVLLFVGGKFMQCLEGPPEAVARTFARIHADPRHRQVQVHVDAATGRRSFETWDMACTEVGDSFWLQLSTATWETRLLVESDRPSGFALLERLWTEQGRP